MAKRLEQAYARYNKKYFSGKLPQIKVQWSELIATNHPSCYRRAYGWMCMNEAEDELEAILIASNTKNMWEVWNSTLLHEMAHVALIDHPEEIAATSDKHSKVWKAEMRRLAAMGAFDEIW